MMTEAECTSRVYTLSDPRTHEIRYVGVTKFTLEQRLHSHISGSRRGKDTTWKSRWIARLLRMGYQPIIELVQEIPHEHRETCEQYWIAYFRAQGCKLTNSSRGGEGPAHIYGRTAESQRRVFSAETRELLRKNATGVKKSPETCRRNSEAQKARHFSPSPEQRKAMSIKMKGRVRSPESSAKMVATRRANNPGWFPNGFVRVKGARVERANHL